MNRGRSAHQTTRTRRPERSFVLVLGGSLCQSDAHYRIEKKNVAAVVEVDAGRQILMKDALRYCRAKRCRRQTHLFYPLPNRLWASLAPPLPHPCRSKKRALCTRQEQGTEEGRLIDPDRWLVEECVVLGCGSRIARDVYGGVV